MWPKRHTDIEETPSLEQLLAEPWGQSPLVELENCQRLQEGGMGNEYLFGSDKNGFYEVDELDAMERAYLRLPSVWLRDPNGNVVELVKDSAVHHQLLGMGYCEVPRPTEGRS